MTSGIANGEGPNEAVIELVPVELTAKRGRVKPVDSVVNGILATRDKYRWAVQWSRERYELFDKAMSDWSFLEELNANVSYLIDFDVLRSYLEERWGDHLSTIAIMHLFEESGRRFYFPPGTYLELLDWLRPSSEQVAKAEPAYDGSQSLAWNVATALGVDVDAPESSMDLAEEIVLVIDKPLSQIERLITILESRRFNGIHSEYDSDDLEILTGLIALTPRKGFVDRPRNLVDRRDAMNLAVACRANRQLTSDSNLLLISLTDNIINLPTYLDPESTRLLSAVLKEPGHMVKSRLPAVSPQRVHILELLGYFSNRMNARLVARFLRRAFFGMNDWLENYADSKTKLGFKRATTAGHMQVARLRDHLRQIEEVFKRSDGRLYLVEASLATEEYVQRVKQLVSWPYLETTTPELGSPSRALDLGKELVEAFESIEGFGYRITAEDAIAPGFRPIGIYQEPAFGPAIPLMTGEHYGDLALQGDLKTGYFCLRWPVYCHVSRFMSALWRALRPRVRVSEESTASPFTLGPVTMTSPLWSEGIVVYSNTGYWGSNLLGFGPEILANAKVLGKALMDVGAADGVDRFYIFHIRINTWFGDFLFDVTPHDNRRTRRCTVISHYNISDIITLLYIHTGSQFVVAPTLARELGGDLRNRGYAEIASLTTGLDAGDIATIG